jgi:hypothetical protein
MAEAGSVRPEGTKLLDDRRWHQEDGRSPADPAGRAGKKESLMPTNQKDCLSETMHTIFLNALVQAEGMHDIPDSREQHIQQAKDALLNGYRLAEEAYQLEVEACKREYPHP